MHWHNSVHVCSGDEKKSLIYCKKKCKRSGQGHVCTCVSKNYGKSVRDLDN